MRVRSEEHQALSRIASRWWGTKDPGVETEVVLRFRRPTTRTDEEVLALFSSIMESLNGGYRSTVTVNIKEGVDG